jgi:uncharacterized protein (DUF2062 family)
MGSFLSGIRAFLWSDLPPWRMGLSAAIGAFIAVTPTIGFQTLLVIALVSLVRGNRGLALVTSGIANPWTIPFIVYIDFKVGSFLLGNGSWVGLTERFTFGTLGDAYMRVLVGSLIVGTALAVIVGALVSAYFHRKRKDKSIIDKREEMV